MVALVENSKIAGMTALSKWAGSFISNRLPCLMGWDCTRQNKAKYIQTIITPPFVRQCTKSFSYQFYNVTITLQPTRSGYLNALRLRIPEVLTRSRNRIRFWNINAFRLRENHWKVCWKMLFPHVALQGNDGNVSVVALVLVCVHRKDYATVGRTLARRLVEKARLQN